MLKRSWDYYLIIMIGIGVFIIPSLMVYAAHFDITLDNPQLINPSINLMIMKGTIKINNQNPEPLDITIPGDLGDEIGMFFNQVLCGTFHISQDSDQYILYSYNYQVINNGPHTGDILNVKIWDESEQIEYDQEVVLEILDNEIKDAQGNLIWEVGDWNVNLSVTTTGMEFQWTSGMDTFGYPVELSASMTSFDFIKKYFTPQKLESIWTYSLTNRWIVTKWSDGGAPTGTEFMIQEGKGYLLYMKEEIPYLFIPGQNTSSSSADLKKGFNLVSFHIPDTGDYNAFSLLKQLDHTKVISVCNYDQQSGKWESAFWFTAKQMGGKNFTLKEGKSYIINMKDPILDWSPTL